MTHLIVRAKPFSSRILFKLLFHCTLPLVDKKDCYMAKPAINCMLLTITHKSVAWPQHHYHITCTGIKNCSLGHVRYHVKLNSTLCIFVQNTWGRKSLGRITFPISPEDIYPPSTISNLSFINLLIEYHSKCPKSHISQWSHIPILFDLKADFHLHPPEAAKLEAKERRRGRGEQIFFISLKIFSSGVHTVPLAIVDSFSRRGLAHLWALSWLFT